MLPDNFDELASVGPPPSKSQIDYVKSLALACGRSFSIPQSKVQAEALIDELLEERKALKGSSGEGSNSFADRRREERDVRRAVAAGDYGTAGWD